MGNYFVEYYLRGFRKYLVCVQNILQTDESTIICMIFGLNKNTIQYNTIYDVAHKHLFENGTLFALLFHVVWLLLNVTLSRSLLPVL